MAARVWLKGGQAYYNLDAEHDELVRAWEESITVPGETPGPLLRTFERAQSGSPPLRVTIDMTEVAAVEAFA